MSDILRASAAARSRVFRQVVAMEIVVLVPRGALCVCDRPMPLEDGLCLKCGRIVPERAGGNHG